MNTFTYEIIEFVTETRSEEPADRVLKVLAAVTGTTPDNRSQTMYCTFEVFPKEGEPFIPFEELTEDIARQWVDADIRQWNVIKLQINTILEEQAAQAVMEQKPLPWAPVPSVENTSTVLDPIMPEYVSPQEIPDERIKALIYEVLAEIEASRV